MKNLKEFKELKKRYETITLKEIKLAFNKGAYDASKRLTGTGSNSQCVLCVAVGRDKDDCTKCKKCVWLSVTGEHCDHKEDYELDDDYGYNEPTYDAIRRARTPVVLRDAYRNRAKHMQIVLAKIKS